MNETVVISTDYMTLGQLLKEVGVIDTGGMAKWFLLEHDIYVNDEIEKRRGRKLYSGDKITIPNVGVFTIVADQ